MFCLLVRWFLLMTAAVMPPIEVAPAVITASVVMHTGHIAWFPR